MDVALDRDRFLRRLLRELSGSLQDVVGLEEAEGFISVVGQAIGEEINGLYRRALEIDHLDRSVMSAVLVDLKRRIEGDFYVISEDENCIVLGNRACPFGDQVVGRPALCMMTSNVFGHIAAENLGYARVHIDRAIARGDDGCRVTIHLRPVDGEVEAETREYFKRAHA
jgi:predicted ArsR family transcriptional regulator